VPGITPRLHSSDSPDSYQVAGLPETDRTSDPYRLSRVQRQGIELADGDSHRTGYFAEEALKPYERFVALHQRVQGTVRHDAPRLQ
jgi:hypothetical protein